MKDYYYILGVSKEASKKEIKAAYRKLSKKFHPDLNEGDKFFEDRFKDVNEAYEALILSNSSSSNKTSSSAPPTETKENRPTITTFYTDKKTVSVNESLKIVWDTTHCTLVKLNIIGKVKLSGEKVLKFKKPNDNLILELSGEDDKEVIKYELSIRIVEEFNTAKQKEEIPIAEEESLLTEENWETTSELENTEENSMLLKKKKQKSSLPVIIFTLLVLSAMILGYSVLENSLKKGLEKEAQGNFSSTTSLLTDIEQAAYSTDNQSEKKAVPAKKSSGYFTIGSTKEEVLVIQGSPTDIYKNRKEETLSYGMSSITIKDGKVREYSNLENNLKIKMQPNITQNTRGFYSIGSTKNEVLIIQGTPTSYYNNGYDETLGYGRSSVAINNNKVRLFDNIDGNLKVK